MAFSCPLLMQSFKNIPSVNGFRATRTATHTLFQILKRTMTSCHISICWIFLLVNCHLKVHIDFTDDWNSLQNYCRALYGSAFAFLSVTGITVIMVYAIVFYFFVKLGIEKRIERREEAIERKNRLLHSWNISIYKQLPRDMKRAIKTMMVLASKKYPTTLPKEVLFIIFNFLCEYKFKK